MKRWIGLAIALVVVFASLAGTASAATGSTEIKVKLNGEWVIFPTPPVLLNGKTYVEFRTLFTKLGYSIDYDAATKTIKAASDARSIQMTPTGTSALVNGTKVPVNGEMKLLNGRTLVGVRFIATLSDKKVAWDGAKKLVTIEDKGPTAQQQAELFAVIKGLGAAEDKQDADAFMALFHSQSPIRDALSATIHSEFAKLHTHTDYMEMSVDEYSATQAVVYAVEDTKKISGTGFYPNVENEIIYTLRKEASGQWAIYDVEQLSVEALDEDSLWAQEVQAPDADKTAINAILGAQNAALTANDKEAFKATYVTSAPGLDDEFASWEDFFSDDTSVFSSKVTRTAIVELNEDSATLLADEVFTITSKDDPTDTSSFRSLTAYKLQKQDGKWLFAPGAAELAGNEVEDGK
ncbi:stalk domain-containing protein [Paenibacillus sp. R14(2021)]|uniref:stalk domain-containing protein n=1 Tax=Paenibacillus sp. R14(2021) TaxID=2859228 RepID=UPI001C611B9F|nr:stalk domain-containing protein [Paenibacillus sp. R14(2021)]